MKRIKAKRLLVLTICYAALTACASRDLQIDTISFGQEAQCGYTAQDSSEDEVNQNKTAEKKISQNEGNPNEPIEESSFLTVDWTDYEILMGHSIEPEDSGMGWEFSVADVDFDGTLEVLVTFAANHCGQNALYIYKQEADRVVSYADTYAVFGKYVTSDIDYKAISPYMDIDLLAAYKSQNQEYRYLSLDYSIFGGNECGNIGTVILYETIPGKQDAPVKLAEISYSLPEDDVEMYFRGEKVCDAGELKERLDMYMQGYTEVEIRYETAEKSFARDIVAQDDEYKEKEREELYQSLEKLLAGTDPEPVKASESTEAGEKILGTGIDIQESFVQIETNSINKRISFPSIDIADAEDMSNYINEQIYQEIVPEDFLEYGHGREDTEVQYEIETVGERIISIHFYGYQTYWGSYAEYNKGMNFNLRTGKLISLKDYYTLSDIKAIIMNARDKNEITISNIPVDEEELQRQIDKFISFFDSEEYIGCNDNFFI